MPSIEAAEERWRLTIDNAPVGIALVDLDGRWLRVNGALCEMLGYSAAAMGRFTFQDITHPDDLEADLELLEQLLAGSIAKYRMRKRYWHAEGHEVPVDLSVSLVRDGDRQPMHFVAHIADLTEEMRAAARIEEMNAALTQQAAALSASNADLEGFALLVSHDLQSPLTTVTGYLQLIHDEQGGRLDADGLDWLVRARAAVDRMSELTQSLLAMSVSEGPLVRVPVSLTRLVAEVCGDLDAEIHEHGAVVEVQADELVTGDPTRLRQVIQNLVQNAVKYRHPDRPVSVRITLASDEVSWRIHVDDNARGVPVERREAIFDLFTRLPASGSAGHGVGLAACRRIVQRHGGRIWVEDNPSGQGSRFVVTGSRQP